MALTTGANGDSNFTLAEMTDYLAKYATAAQEAAWTGLASEGERERMARRGSSYVDTNFARRFPGVPANGATQARAWPRKNAATRDGLAIASDVVPQQVKWASMEAALREAVTPGILSPDFAPGALAIKRSEAVGSIKESVEFASAKDAMAAQRTVASRIEDLLSIVLVDPDNQVTGFVV